jgi:hypothetical protein
MAARFVDAGCERSYHRSSFMMPIAFITIFSNTDSFVLDFIVRGKYFSKPTLATYLAPG